MVSRAAAGYFNVTNPGEAVRIVDIDGLEPAFSWNVAVGMSKPDANLRRAIDNALERLTADGTIQRIYAKYGVMVRPPN